MNSLIISELSDLLNNVFSANNKEKIKREIEETERLRIISTLNLLLQKIKSDGAFLKEILEKKRFFFDELNKDIRLLLKKSIENNDFLISDYAIESQCSLINSLLTEIKSLSANYILKNDKTVNFPEYKKNGKALIK